MRDRQRHIILIALLSFFALSGAYAQDAQLIYRASWTIQDRMHGLRQDIARTIIYNANDWLTRDNASAPTARLDDPVRVTVVGEMLPPTGRVRTRLAELRVGTIVINGSFEEFLDTATISSIIRRDHYWRDETYESYNTALAPAYAATPLQTPGTSPHIMQGHNEHPRTTIALDASSIRLNDGTTLWAGLGFEEAGLPDFTYGKARIGIAHQGMKVWGELPVNAGDRDNALLARGLEGTFGAGLSFQTGSITGAVTWNDAPEDSITTSLYQLDRSALLYATVLQGNAPFMNGGFTLSAGLGYRHLAFRTPGTDGSRETFKNIDRIDPILRMEFGTAPIPTGEAMRLSAELYGPSLLASWSQQITPVIGYRISTSLHSLYGSDQDQFLPAWSFLVSPIITLW